MHILFDEEDARTVADAMAKSRGVVCDFNRPFSPDSTENKIYSEALRVVAALRDKHDGAYAAVLPGDKHKFQPDRKYPQFCEHCGYGPNEQLVHT